MGIGSRGFPRGKPALSGNSAEPSTDGKTSSHGSRRRRSDLGFSKAGSFFIGQPVFPLWLSRGRRHQVVPLEFPKDVHGPCVRRLIGEPTWRECSFKLIPRPLPLVFSDQAQLRSTSRFDSPSSTSYCHSTSSGWEGQRGRERPCLGMEQVSVPIRVQFSQAVVLQGGGMGVIPQVLVAPAPVGNPCRLHPNGTPEAHGSNSSRHTASARPRPSQCDAASSTMT